MATCKGKQSREKGNMYTCDIGGTTRWFSRRTGGVIPNEQECERRCWVMRHEVVGSVRGAKQ
jgi:hypothetical protein